MLRSVWHHERDIVAMLEQALDQRDDGEVVAPHHAAKDRDVLARCGQRQNAEHRQAVERAGRSHCDQGE